MIVPDAIAHEYLDAQAARQEVCRQDCDWPRGDGECSSCRRERKALLALEAVLNGGSSS